MNKVQEININNVCKEVITILGYFNEDLVDKIPDKVLKELTNLAADSEVDFYINPEEDLDKQEISEEGKDLIAVIYYNYIADTEEKLEIFKEWNTNEQEFQKKLRTPYNLDEIFKNKVIDTDTTSFTNTMIEYKKQTIFDKIKSFIKNILRAAK